MKEIKNENYLNKLNKSEELDQVISLIHDKARELEVPIIQDDGLDFLLMIVRTNKPKKILEIGTAVGFSAIMMAKNCDAFIDTIERNSAMYDEAINNIKKTNLENRIHVFNADALLIDNALLKNNYDLIFIDAGKAQNQKFFLKYSPLLNDNGLILTDNILFHGYVEEYAKNGTLENASKDLRAMVRKIHEYNIWLSKLDDYETSFINVGDGIAVTKKRNKYEK